MPAARGRNAFSELLSLCLHLLDEGSAYTILPYSLASSRFLQTGKEVEFTGNQIPGVGEFCKAVSCFLPLIADILCPLAVIFSVSLSVHFIILSEVSYFEDLQAGDSLDF